MPTIHEEAGDMADLTTPDFTELLSLRDSPMAIGDDLPIGTTAGDDALQALMASQTPFADCLAPDYMGAWDLPEPSADPYLGLEEPDYAKFENWIPQFIRPAKPCDYCRVKRLNCYITRGETACTPCSSLFRDCTLTKTRTLETANQSTGHLLDTLHVVDEDAVIERGSVTGIKPLRSKALASGTSTPSRLDDAPGSNKRNGIRFPRHAVKTLRDWLDAHADNPYPTEDEKTELEAQTGLKPSQIANWLANARRRRKVTEKARPKLCSSPSLKPTTPAIDIPQQDKPWHELNPFERWQNSPPEHEPASITDIANAVANSELGDDHISTSPSSQGRYKKRSSNGSGFSEFKAPSTTSLETRQTASFSASNSIADSHHSSQSHGSFGSFNSSLAGKRERRRRKRTLPAPMRKLGDDKKRVFQCTFCTDTFKSKYDWTRHEKSLHLSLEKWICAPLGPVITDPSTGNKRCVYCDELNPTPEHLETHNHRQCEEKGLDARTFYRKDHLRQHIRLMHNCEMTPFMDKWKSTAVNINCRCGFCGQRFTIWQERVDHLTAHFKAGARMSQWKGCRGLDPAVAAQVTNAMPPYLIGEESISPIPFSATDKRTWRHSVEHGHKTPMDSLQHTSAQGQDYLFQPETSELEGFGSKATCWEILTVRLGKYANDMAKKGVVLTDEMLQSQARIILYDSDDAWNHTAADNPEWLDLFKKAHGLDFIPSQIGGHGAQIPDDLETYGDLGLRIPFAVQLRAYNQQHSDEICTCDPVFGEHTKQAHMQKTTEQMRILYRILAREGVLYDANGKCKHTECNDNILEVGNVDAAKTTKYRWCTYDLSLPKAQQVTRLRKPELDVPNPGSPDSSPQSLTHRHHLPRHKYELPQDRAERFQTVTGAWQDSGLVPEAMSTQQHHTTTGAMMEFLGGDVGRDLPFSADVATSSIVLPQEYDSIALPTTAAQEEAMLADIDRLIAETTQAPLMTDSSWPATTTEMQLPSDFTMTDLGLDDMDMTFDGVFDMTVDEPLGSGQVF